MSLLNSLLNQKQKNAKQLHISTTDNNNNNHMDTTTSTTTTHMYYNPLSYKQLLSPLTIISSSQRRNADKSDFSFAKRFNYFNNSDNKVDANTTLPQQGLDVVRVTNTTATATSTWSPAIGSEYAFKKSQPLNIINGHQRAITKTSEANSLNSNTCYSPSLDDYYCPSGHQGESAVGFFLYSPPSTTTATACEQATKRSDKFDFSLLVQQASLIRHETGKRMMCNFCRNNNETELIYTSHTLKDSLNRIVCPVLRAYGCPKCGATGDLAHTLKYCPILQKNAKLNKIRRYSSNASVLKF